MGGVRAVVLLYLAVYTWHKLVLQLVKCTYVVMAKNMKNKLVATLGILKTHVLQLLAQDARQRLSMDDFCMACCCVTGSFT